MANEGLGWDSLLKMVHNPGGDCYWEGGQPKVYATYNHNGLFSVHFAFHFASEKIKTFRKLALIKCPGPWSIGSGCG